MSENSHETKDFCIKFCTVTKRLDGQVAVVTGATTGLGLVTAGELARRGCVVIMACPDMELATQNRERLLEKFGTQNPESVNIELADESMANVMTTIKPKQLILEELDLGSFVSVRHFADRLLKTYSKIHYLVNNAGLMLPAYETTVDGFEKTIQINYLGHFLLTELVQPALKNGQPSRIINLSSLAHRWGSLHKPDLQIQKSHYNGIVSYAQSKLANLMHAREINKRLNGNGVVAVAVHPGCVTTDFQRNMITPEMKKLVDKYRAVTVNTWQGVQTIMFALLTSHLEPGAYYGCCAVEQPQPNAMNDADCIWLYEKSCELVGLK